MTNQKKKKIFPIRWIGLSLFLVLFLTIGFFIMVLINPLLRTSLKFVFQKINKAEVNINSSRISFLQSSFKTKGLQWTNGKKPKNNLFSIDQIKFQFSPSYLLRRRVYIQQMRLEGLVIGDKRSKKGWVKKQKTQKKSSSSSSSPNNLLTRSSKFTKEQQNQLSKTISKKAKTINEKQKTYETIITQTNLYWQNHLKQVQDFSKIEDKINTLKKIKTSDYRSLKDLGKLKKDIDEAKQLRSTLKDKTKQIKQTEKKFNKTIAFIDQEAKALEDFKENNFKEVTDLFDLSEAFEAKNISQILFGANISSLFFRYYGNYLRYKSYLPQSKKPKDAKKQTKKLPKKLLKGRTIDFRNITAYPVFYVNQMVFSSANKKINPSKSTHGTLNALSSDLSFKPMTLAFTSTDKQKHFDLKASFYTHKEKGKQNNLSLSYQNIPIAKDALNETGQNSVIKEIENGTLNTFVEFSETKQLSSVKATLFLNNLKLSLHPQENPFIERAFTDIFSNLKKTTFQIQMTFKVSEKGDITDSHLTLKSDLDLSLNQKFKDYFTKKINQQKKKLQKIFDEKLIQNTAISKQLLEKEVGSQIKQIKQQSQDLKKQIEKKKKDLEKQLNKKLKENQKNLLKQKIKLPKF